MSGQAAVRKYGCSARTSLLSSMFASILVLFFVGITPPQQPDTPTHGFGPSWVTDDDAHWLNLDKSLIGSTAQIPKHIFDKASSHLGSLKMLNNALKAAISRGELKIAIMGGSVSRGTGCKSRARDAWYTVMTRSVARQFVEQGIRLNVTLTNAAQGATSSQRMAYCWKKILARRVDIVVLEYAINDSGGSWAEVLLRDLLENNIAVFFLESFSLLRQANFTTVQMYHDVLGRYYDVPVISARDAYREVFQNNDILSSRWFSPDFHHPSCVGHTTLGALAAALIHRAHHLHTLNADLITGLQPVTVTQLPVLDLDNIFGAHISSNRQANCLMSADLAITAPSWTFTKGSKPTVDCTSPDDGELVIPITCPHSRQDPCQLVFAYTRSWQPMGTVDIFLNTSEKSIFTLDGFAESWRDSGKRKTVQTFTTYNEPRLQIPPGVTLVRLMCTGNSSAPVNISSSYNRTLLQIHSLVLF